MYEVPQPKRRRKISLKKQGSNRVVNRPYHPFGSSILLRRIGTRKTKIDTFLREQGMKLRVVILCSIIALKVFDFRIEMSFNVIGEEKKLRVHVFLRSYWKNPQKMCELIQEKNVVFHSTKTKNWRCPYVRVDDLEGSSDSCIRI